MVLGCFNYKASTGFGIQREAFYFVNIQAPRQLIEP
jgi:hypothetical protein